MIMIRQVWYVRGEPDVYIPTLFETKDDAERYVRILFPTETSDQRYNRIAFRPVFNNSDLCGG
jgi:hypothetical protein